MAKRSPRKVGRPVKTRGFKALTIRLPTDVALQLRRAAAEVDCARNDVLLFVVGEWSRDAQWRKRTIATLKSRRE